MLTVTDLGHVCILVDGKPLPSVLFAFRFVSGDDRVKAIAEVPDSPMGHEAATVLLNFTWIDVKFIPVNPLAISSIPVYEAGEEDTIPSIRPPMLDAHGNHITILTPPRWWQLRRWRDWFFKGESMELYGRTMRVKKTPTNPSIDTP